ncbi:orotidine 5'-phosphate decarboxylase [Candidatus Uhrbacteria bacterium RIFCSPHIGHO2_01_FULL_63_20]|uniref:Orotidine 5'-phosphate decarboxylase n=1 Tax=Candidatus Uhrbacteria bacterium RIFCSPHIGHO2_01_FULL_63_20 TaxID=1802385 RepID=A0A1F7TLV7_9BACT|nr:MAG: orotidine 5'-phosphate decarboxylase [Candidatus Uhrbacteria bacterium RIFCSPHIGHO2_01_FULL_63_20]
MTPQEAAKKIIVALDSDNDAFIRAHAAALGAHVGMLKIGMQAFVAFGPAIVREAISSGCRVFLDLKFVDIPRTVAGAVRAATKHGVSMMNVYAETCEEGMRAAVKARDEGWEFRHKQFPEEPRPMLIAVTVLTSQKHPDLVKVGTLSKPNVLFGSADLLASAVDDAGEKALRDLVVKRAMLAKECGLDGVVCSPEEIRLVREACGKDFKIVTPGIRPAWAEAKDQKRMMTPGQAEEAGADYQVIGTPILDPPALIGSSQTAVSLIVKEICGSEAA